MALLRGGFGIPVVYNKVKELCGDQECERFAKEVVVEVRGLSS
jgi:hypothetical protein